MSDVTLKYEGSFTLRGGTSEVPYAVSCSARAATIAADVTSLSADVGVQAALEKGVDEVGIELLQGPRPICWASPEGRT